MDTAVDVAWHAMAADDVAKRLVTKNAIIRRLILDADHGEADEGCDILAQRSKISRKASEAAESRRDHQGEDFVGLLGIAASERLEHRTQYNHGP